MPHPAFIAWRGRGKSVDPERSEDDGGDDAERMAALRRAGMLESGQEVHLDSVLRRAATLFNVPMAAVLLADATRRAFRASIGVGLPFAEADLAFCEALTRAERPLVLGNVQAFPAFADDPVVQGRPGIRFLAAAPAVADDGTRYGVLCVLDRRARAETTAEELAGLAALAAEAARIFRGPSIEMKPERGW